MSRNEGTSLCNLVLSSELSRFFPAFIATARRPSQVLPTSFERRKLIEMSERSLSFTTRWRRHRVRRAVRLRQLNRLFITGRISAVRLPVDTAVHRAAGVLWRWMRMRMEILLLMLVQLLQLSVPFHLRGGTRRRRRRGAGRVEAGPWRRLLRQGGRRRGRGGRAGRLRRALFDVVVLAEDAIVVQVESISDTEPYTYTQSDIHIAHVRLHLQRVTSLTSHAAVRCSTTFPVFENTYFTFFQISKKTRFYIFSNWHVEKSSAKV